MNDKIEKLRAERSALMEAAQYLLYVVSKENNQNFVRSELDFKECKSLGKKLEKQADRLEKKIGLLAKAKRKASQELQERIYLGHHEEYLALTDPKEIHDYEVDFGLSEEKDYHLGWVSPKGKFWPVNIAAHERFLGTILGLTILEAEEQGWIRLTSNCGYGSPVQFRGKRMTPKQKRKLFDLGFSEEDME